MVATESSQAIAAKSADMTASCEVTTSKAATKVAATAKPASAVVTCPC